MKRLVNILIIMLLIMGITPTVLADEKPISILVDGKVIDIPDGQPYINSDGRTMVPVRFISENLGCEVKWEVGDIITIQDKNVKIVFTVGKYNAKVTKLSTGVTRLAVFDTKSVVKDGRTMVPVRFISETLDAKVDWDESTNQVSILSSGNYTKPSHPEYYNRMYETRNNETLTYNPEEPFEIEYFGITKEEIENNPVLNALSQLPNCTCINKLSENSKNEYTFAFEEVNAGNYNNLNPIFFITLFSDFSGMHFDVSKNNTLTLGLLRNTLSILYKNDEVAQDIIYRQILNQRTASKYYYNQSLLNKYNLFIDKTSECYWKEEAFNVWGTVYLLK